MSTYNIENLLASFDKADVISREFAAGDIVFQEGATVSHVYFVLEGEVRVLRYLLNGQELVFFRAKGGASLSEAEVFVNKHPYTAVATVDSRLALIQKTQFLKLLHSQPSFTEQFLFCMTWRYTESLMVRELLSVRSADERLLMWFQWRANMGEEVLNLEGRMGNLGAELGLTRESVYRSLARLEKRKFIERQQGVVRVLKR